MGKDHDLLKGVSDCFTEETLREIVAKEKDLKPSDVEIVSWDFGKASAKGEGYLSTVNKVGITGRKVSDGEPLETKIVVKSLPKNIGRRKTFRSVEFFHNESIFYGEIAPRFESFLKSKNQSHLLSIPRCLALRMDGENDFIALQDVRQLGFVPVTRQTVITYEQFKYIVEAMARFHSISFAYKHEKKEEFDGMVSLMIETYFTEHLYETWYKKYHINTLLRIAKDALAKEYPGSCAEKRFNSYAPGELAKKAIEICSKMSAPTSVISQGDAWAPNYFIRERSPGKFDVLMLDFQLAKCASPVLDVAVFIYTCSDKALRDTCYHQILKDYYTELNKSSSLLGLNLSQVYPWEHFLKEVKEQSVFGLVFALEAVPFSMLTADQAFDLDSIKGDEKIDISEIYKLQNIEIPENRQRLADIIVHAVENEFI